MTYLEFDADEEKDKRSTVIIADIGTERFSGIETRVAVVEERSEGEQIANATHLKLGIDSADDSIMAIGTLKLTVSSVTR